MPKNILVIDDEAAVRTVFARALNEYAVETAATGEEGIAKALRYKPDLAFVDLKMPGIDGVETLQRLQNLYNELPVYIVTGFAREYMEPLQAAVRQGYNFDVAHKPLSAGQIRLIADSILAGSALSE